MPDFTYMMCVNYSVTYFCNYNKEMIMISTCPNYCQKHELTAKYIHIAQILHTGTCTANLKCFFFFFWKYSESPFYNPLFISATSDSGAATGPDHSTGSHCNLPLRHERKPSTGCLLAKRRKPGMKLSCLFFNPL